MITRRDMLQRIGLVGAASIVWACGPRGAPPQRPTPAQQSDEVRGWLRGAVARLASKFPTVHALASTRRRSSAAVDVLGAGVARGRSDGVVIVVRDHDGRWREEVSSDLSAAGVTAIVRALGAAGAGPALVGFGRVGHAQKLVGVDPRDLSDGQLRARAERMAADPGGAMSSRIVYASGLLEIDDATVWSVAPDHDLEQRLVRVRRSAARVAWNGTRPVVGQVGLGWRGGVDDRALEPADLVRAARGALELMTPSRFPDGAHQVLLHPEVAAAALDAIARALLVASAQRRPEVAARLAIGAQLAHPAITVIDDPTDATAYGGFAFDDEGEPARPLTLLQGGRIVARLGDRASAPAIPGGRGLRPGHHGLVAAGPSHLTIAPGATPSSELVDEGFVLEGAGAVTLDPSSGRITIAAARARELRARRPTGRVFADVELVGDLGILATMTAASREREELAFRDEQDGLPRWRSFAVPWIVARGHLRGRRT